MSLFQQNCMMWLVDIIFIDLFLSLQLLWYCSLFYWFAQNRLLRRWFGCFLFINFLFVILFSFRLESLLVLMLFIAFRDVYVIFILRRPLCRIFNLSTLATDDLLILCLFWRERWVYIAFYWGLLLLFRLNWMTLFFSQILIDLLFVYLLL